jgi:hypothetical protein
LLAEQKEYYSKKISPDLQVKTGGLWEYKKIKWRGLLLRRYSVPSGSMT